MNYRTILSESSDNVTTIRLDRPTQMNALNADMRRELTHALKAAGDASRAIILTGNGRGFCAGQDLGDTATLSQVDLEQTLTEEYGPLLSALADCPVPVVAAVNGAAAGGGANIALAADICIAAHSASFLQAFARIGLIPDCGGTYWLPRRIGMARAIGLSMLAEPISAATAAEWGLIWEAVPDGDLQVRAREVAVKLATGPTAAFTAMKKALRMSLTNSLEDQLLLEASLQGERGQSHDFKEGVVAFLEKRPAKFTGR